MKCFPLSFHPLQLVCWRLNQINSCRLLAWQFLRIQVVFLSSVVHGWDVFQFQSYQATRSEIDLRLEVRSRCSVLSWHRIMATKPAKVILTGDLVHERALREWGHYATRSKHSCFDKRPQGGIDELGNASTTSNRDNLHVSKPVLFQKSCQPRELLSTQTWPT